MTSHDLANKLLKLPNLTLGLNVYGHFYHTEAHRFSHGPLKIWKSSQGTLVIGCSPSMPKDITEILDDGRDK